MEVLAPPPRFGAPTIHSEESNREHDQGTNVHERHSSSYTLNTTKTPDASKPGRPALSSWKNLLHPSSSMSSEKMVCVLNALASAYPESVPKLLAEYGFTLRLLGPDVPVALSPEASAIMGQAYTKWFEEYSEEVDVAGRCQPQFRDIAAGGSESRPFEVVVCDTIHEVAHAIDYILGEERQHLSDGEEWTARYNNTKQFLSPYFATDVNEFFVECMLSATHHQNSKVRWRKDKLAVVPTSTEDARRYHPSEIEEVQRLLRGLEEGSLPGSQQHERTAYLAGTMARFEADLSAKSAPSFVASFHDVELHHIALSNGSDDDSDKAERLKRYIDVLESYPEKTRAILGHLLDAANELLERCL